eukprot:TRINITY_DN28999_c0_g1_i1.p1 TRINITY_DN28999_c0_g1~~TRINITY_DN28999_c0_g1_i1.p1  ORF type:complete len:1124 (-),score=243.24 TRINITY_DN28999_c0_g1_i1:240-3611(-)
MSYVHVAESSPEPSTAGSSETSSVGSRGSSESGNSLVRVTLSAEGVVVTPLRRRIHGKYPNAVKTALFTWLTWLPKSLYWQLHRIANLYFLLIAILACTPIWAGNGKQWAGKVATVASILLIQAAKDLYEDMKRWRDDAQENRQTTRHYNFKVGSEGFDDVEWRSCGVGDLVLLRDGEAVPADMLVLASSESAGECYISTMSLDGETNLKRRSVPAKLHKQGGASGTSVDGSVQGLLSKDIQVQLEDAHASLLSMTCVMTFETPTGQETSGLSIENFLLRGCVLRNTEWVVGLCCYVGRQTKVVQNATQPRTKVSELETYLNRCVVAILLVIFAASFAFAIGEFMIGSKKGDNQVFGEVFVTYLIILYNVLPMSLYIMFETLRLILGKWIEIDKRMTDGTTGAAAAMRNTSVVEEMGQVSYIFSDKTGTLTANEMRFAFCCIGEETLGPFIPTGDAEAGSHAITSTSYHEVELSSVGGGDSSASTARPPAEAEASGGVRSAKAMLARSGAASEMPTGFFTLLAVCNTVKPDGGGLYQGESPDEVALAEAAASVGVKLLSSVLAADQETKTVQMPSGNANQFTISHVLEFTSARKRMSVVCQLQDGRALVLTKGADSIMEPLMQAPFPLAAHQTLEDFSRQGYRTLVLGQRYMTAAEYADWAAQWAHASASMSDREAKLEAVTALAERGLTYLGVTALEDRLQDDVPATIETLRAAGIHVLVLTGDKVETAVEIAKSCKLFELGMTIDRVVGATSVEDAVDKLAACSAKATSSQASGLVLDGASVELIFRSEEAKHMVYELFKSCSSCVCCRLSPMQKKQLVELVREMDKRAITLAIGDGANDVPMIQGAHVGVGIRGKEGTGSVQASDVAISQFKFLANLVVCHGRKAYRRIAIFLGFFMYKSMFIGFTYLYYAMFDEFGGTLAYPELLDLTYSAVTSLSVVIILAYDSDVKDSVALRTPTVYQPGPAREYLNVRVFVVWMAFAFVHGFFACLPWNMPELFREGAEKIKEGDHIFQMSSFTTFSVMVIIVHLKLIIIAEHPMHPFGVAALALEIAGYIVIAAVLSMPALSAVADGFTGIPAMVLRSMPHVMMLIVIPIVALIPDCIHMCIQRCRRRRRLVAAA